MVQIAASSSRTSCASEPLLSSSSTTPTSAELTCRGARTTHAFVKRLPPPPPPPPPLPLPPPPREGATCTRTFTASDMSMCSFVEPGQLPTAPAPAATSAAAPSPSWSSGSVSSMQPYAAYIFGPRSGGSDQWGSAEARLSWPVREVYAANGIAAAQSACCLGSSSAKSAAGGKSLSFSSRAAEPSSIPPERCSFRRAAERRAGSYPSKKSPTVASNSTSAPAASERATSLTPNDPCSLARAAGVHRSRRSLSPTPASKSGAPRRHASWKARSDAFGGSRGGLW
mmetsp:Transcript_49103/g.159553  ORF Transcript_49103/g.159553 Transcript_49103/m.159553 type:complete len:284 (-) Transcript_49103:180-1031(-)